MTRSAKSKSKGNAAALPQRDGGSVNDNNPAALAGRELVGHELAGHELAGLDGLARPPAAEAVVHYARRAQIGSFPAHPGAADGDAAEAPAVEARPERRGTRHRHAKARVTFACLGSVLCHVVLFITLATAMVAAPEDPQEEAGDTVSVVMLGDADLDQMAAGVESRQPKPDPEKVVAEAVQPDSLQPDDAEPDAVQPVETPPLRPETAVTQAATTEPEQAKPVETAEAAQPAQPEPAAETPAAEPVQAAQPVDQVSAETVVTPEPEVLASEVPAEPTVVQPEATQIQPAETQPAGAQPAETPPVEVQTQAAEAQPQETQPAEAQAVPAEPAEAQPSAQPVEAAEVAPDLPVPEEVVTPTEKPTPRPVEKPKDVPKKKPPVKARAKAGSGGDSEQDARKGSSEGTETAQSDTNSQSEAHRTGTGSAAVANYPGKVQSRIRRSVRVPTQYQQVTASMTVRVRLTIGASGDLTSLSLARSSGIADLDEAVVEGVRRAAPFPPLPPEWGRPSWSFTQEVQVTGR